MKKPPTLRGRYERSVLSPLQWRVLAVIGYVLLLGFQVEELLQTSFSLELFDQEVIRVQRVERRQPTFHPARHRAPAAAIPAVMPEDWPPPPTPTAWTPARPDDDQPQR